MSTIHKQQLSTDIEPTMPNRTELKTRPLIRTKIVATLGPAVNSEEMLEKIFEQGVDVCRLNFSHGTLEQHLETLRMVRLVAQRFHEPIAILGDLCGPKIRLDDVPSSEDPDKPGSPIAGMRIHTGEILTIQRQPILGKNARVSVSYPELIDDVNVGDRLLIEDGLLRFRVEEKRDDEIICRCQVGGILQTRKGVNLPDTDLQIPAITERDWECAQWAVDQELDYLALSFVSRSKDVRDLKNFLEEQNSTIDVISKIEKPLAVERIDSILEYSDGLMVARGDLGVEMDLAHVPMIQKELVRRAQEAGKPVIVATQMLQSMVDNATPTRAEASDVANAIYDGTDAVMLSGETSVGKYPEETVRTMAHIAKATEQYQMMEQKRPGNVRAWGHSRDHYIPLAHGLWHTVDQMDARMVVVWSETGNLARIFSKLRLRVPVIAISTQLKVLRQMSIYFGVIPLHCEKVQSIDELHEQVDEMLINGRYAEKGDRIVIVASTQSEEPGLGNAMIIHRIGE